MYQSQSCEEESDSKFFRRPNQYQFNPFPAPETQWIFPALNLLIRITGLGLGDCIEAIESMLGASELVEDILMDLDDGGGSKGSDVSRPISR